MQEISCIHYPNRQQINKTVRQFILKFPENKNYTSNNIYNMHKREYYKQNAGQISHRVFSM